MKGSETLTIRLGTQQRVGDAVIGIKGISDDPSSSYAKLRIAQGGAEPVRVDLPLGESAMVDSLGEIRLIEVVGPEQLPDGTGPVGSGHIVVTLTASSGSED